MSIGLYDADMLQYCPVPFNLELMKISSYYKNKKEIVGIMENLDCERYTQVFYFQDYFPGEYHHNLFKYNNIKWGGKAFSSKYTPLAIDIEKEKADTTIYQRYKEEFIKSKKLAEFNYLMDATHLRLSLDGKTIWEDYEKQLSINDKTKMLFFYDYNITSIENSYEEIIKLIDKMPDIYRGKQIGFKYPIRITSAAELKKWSKLNLYSGFHSFLYRGMMTEEFLKALTEEKNKEYNLRYDITYGLNNESEFLLNRIQQIYYQVLYLRMHSIKISLIYKDNFFTDRRWEKLIFLFNCFLSSGFKEKTKKVHRIYDVNTLFNFAANLNKYKMKEGNITLTDAQEVFLFVKEKDYNLYKSFNHCFKVHFKKGELVPYEN